MCPLYSRYIQPGSQIWSDPVKDTFRTALWVIFCFLFFSGCKNQLLVVEQAANFPSFNLHLTLCAVVIEIQLFHMHLVGNCRLHCCNPLINRNTLGRVSATHIVYSRRCQLLHHHHHHRTKWECREPPQVLKHCLQRLHQKSGCLQHCTSMNLPHTSTTSV